MHVPYGFVITLLFINVVVGREHRSDLHIVPHAVDLDSTTFDKVVPKQEVALVMFIEFLAYGTKQLEFKKFAESTATQPSVLAATVGVTEFDEQNNLDLARRFQLDLRKIEQEPLFKLFVNGIENATFAGTVTCDNLREFVRVKSGLWVGRTGTLEYYEKLVTEYMSTSSASIKKEIADQADKHIDEKLTNEDHIKSAQYYVRVMDKYMEEGASFLGFESARLKKLRAVHKFHKHTVCGIDKQINILESFINSHQHMPHDEL